MVGQREETRVDVVLWILAVILVVAGIVELVRKGSSRSRTVRGIALILAGLIAAPGLAILT